MATTDLNRVWLRTEKVAGSSPAELAPNSPAYRGFCCRLASFRLALSSAAGTHEG